MSIGYLMDIRTSPQPHWLLPYSWFARLSNCWWLQQKKTRDKHCSMLRHISPMPVLLMLFTFTFSSLQSGVTHGVTFTDYLFPVCIRVKMNHKGPFSFQAQVKKGGFSHWPTSNVKDMKCIFWLARTNTSCTAFPDLLFHTHTPSFLLPSKGTLSFTLWLQVPKRERTYCVREQRWEVYSIQW